MQMEDLLAQLGGIQSMARELGVSEADASKGAAALAPAVLGGLKKQAQAQPDGVEGLTSLLGGLGGGGLLESVLSSAPTDVGRGNELLGQLFGSKDVSRAVAQKASAQTGLDSGLLKKMLPMLAMAVAGMMAKQGGSDSAADAAPAGGGLGGMLGGLLGGLAGGRQGSGSGSGLMDMLDMNGDGNPLDDIMRMVNKPR